MKKALDWDEDYILSLPQGEHDWLEFKSSRLLDFTLPGVNANDVFSELSKQVSAFANSGGGTIVYGVQDTPIGTLRTVDADGGVSLILKKGTKEWLEDIIPNLVDFPLSSFNVYVVTAKDATSGIATDKGLFLIDIATSDAAPHQAKDKKYYARVGGKSQPIGHRLVMDIVGRAKYPKLKISCSILPKEKRLPHESKDALRFFCENIGRIFANYVNGYIYIPSDIHDPINKNVQTINSKKYNRVWFDNTHQDIVGWRNAGLTSEPYTITRYDPVLPELGFRAAVEELSISKEDLTKYVDEFIYWEIFADNAPKEEGMIKISELIKG
ncbi:MAG TPA: ATP-binding protein [Pyrinomonadaceae bacterium]|jgi:hypothetical protein